MTIARTVERFLIQHGTPYDLVAHPHAEGAAATARATHVPGAQMAKAVVLEDVAGNYVMVVTRADQHVSLQRVLEQLGRKLTLASEPELNAVFGDCETGAIPPLGPAYGMETYVDSTVTLEPEVYFEAGDHQEVVHMPTERFLHLLGQPVPGDFSASTD